MADADQVPHAAAEHAIVEQLNPPAEGSLRYDDSKPLRQQRKDGKNWVEVAVLARNLGCYTARKTAT